MTRNTKIFLETSGLLWRRQGGKCEICNKPANATHHIDMNIQNNKKKNLIILCNKCHSNFHNPNKKEKRVEIKLSYSLYNKIVEKQIEQYRKTGHRSSIGCLIRKALKKEYK